ncbi:unnamed protein product [Schistosoma mattheei]|uniref:Uncharacterized protein n=1 Tax=Schistosoma mattheei TaxID=31246 RepID=A0A183PZ57_9TREM|nr:unnamed protein product [Schistosoma mattheei]
MLNLALHFADRKELSSTEFEVVSCASPIRDARRYQQRQRIAELEFAEKNLHKTTVSADSLFEWDHQTSQSVSQSTSKLSISDISPNSSGFGSLYSPRPSITSEEDHFNELQLYLARNEASTPSQHISPSVTTDSIAIGTTNNNNSSISDVDNQKSDILSPSTFNDELIDLSSWDRLEKLKQKRLINNSTNSRTIERNPRNLFKHSTEQMSSKIISSKHAMKRQVKESMAYYDRRLSWLVRPNKSYNDPMQIPNILSKQEQLCFIQAVQNDNNVTYKLMNDGYLVMDIDFNNFCDIYHLVFPFLNSKCPSTWKKDVHITVTLIDENE